MQNKQLNIFLPSQSVDCRTSGIARCGTYDGNLVFLVLLTLL
jgi:hypothetical protein